MKFIKKRHETNRLESFSDAVFAFSATLLVVSLEVPATFAELVAELKGFAAFGVSFGALILIWSVHNAFFRRYGLQDRLTVFLNACLLFVVLFYVYPLKFVVEGLVSSFFGIGNAPVGIQTFNELGVLFMLYSGGFVAVFLCVSLLYFHVYRSSNHLELTQDEKNEARFYFRHYLIFVFVGLLSILLSWTGVGLRFGLPGFIYGLLGPLCYVHGAFTQRGKPKRVGAAE